MYCIFKATIGLKIVIKYKSTYVDKTIHSSTTCQRECRSITHLKVLKNDYKRT